MLLIAVQRGEQGKARGVEDNSWVALRTAKVSWNPMHLDNSFHTALRLFALGKPDCSDLLREKSMHGGSLVQLMMRLRMTRHWLANR